MKAMIKENRELVPRYFTMTLSEMGDDFRGEPGQFVMIRGDWGTDPLLARPLSICRFLPKDGQIRIVYRVMGKGTRRLSEMKAGQPVDINGPLGNPFPRPDESRRVILTAGAIGAPPLIALAGSMVVRPLLIIGGRTCNDVVFISDEIRELDIETIYVTEDGSYGQKGTAVTELARHVGGNDLVYSCGPNRMLAEIARLSGKIGFEAHVSFEERMACGIGVCLGCAVRRADGAYVHVCKDGPVFNVTDIDWDRL
jgi:dihydroorotate dehydrogenase electron transfer subunit